MRMRVEYNPEFFNDIYLAVSWYNEKKVGLGEHFFKSVRKQTRKLSKTAHIFAVKYDDIRCMPIEKFPYLVHYRVNQQNKTVKVEAILHTSRDPQDWRSSYVNKTT